MKSKIEKFLSELNTEIDVLYMVDINDIDKSDAFDSIRDMIENNSGFNVEIIYYANAIEYLQKNDPSLQESLSLAHDMGYTCGNLNSETLASILASENVRNEFNELEDEINEFFENLPEFTRAQKRRNRIFKNAKS